MRPSRSLSLTRSSPTSRNVGASLRPRGQHGEQRNLVDQAGDLAGRHLGAAERAGPHDQIAHRLAEPVGAGSRLRTSRAHPARAPRGNPIRVGLSPTPAIAELARLRPARRRRPGTRPTTGRPAPRDRTARAGRPARSRIQPSCSLDPVAEGAEQPLGVVPGAAVRLAQRDLHLARPRRRAAARS